MFVDYLLNRWHARYYEHCAVHVDFLFPFLFCKYSAHWREFVWISEFSFEFFCCVQWTTEVWRKQETNRYLMRDRIFFGGVMPLTLHTFERWPRRHKKCFHISLLAFIFSAKIKPFCLKLYFTKTTNSMTPKKSPSLLTR